MVAETAAAARAITLDDVADVVTRYHGVMMDDLRGRSQASQYARPRLAFMYLARWVAFRQLPEIGKYLDRDHSTVFSGAAKVERRRKVDAELDREISEMSHSLRATAGHSTEPPEVIPVSARPKFYDVCEMTVSRYVFGLTDLMVALASNGVPRGAWVERVEIDGSGLRLSFRWEREVAS